MYRFLEVVENRFYMQQNGEGLGAQFQEKTTYSPGTQIPAANPTLALIRGTTYSFDLATFSFLTWNIFRIIVFVRKLESI